MAAPKPCLESSDAEVCSLKMKNLTADDCLNIYIHTYINTGSVFALLHILAAQLPVSHASFLQYRFLSLYHMHIQVTLHRRLKSEVSQPA